MYLFFQPNIISHTNLTISPSHLKFPMESALLDIFSKVNPSFAYQNKYNLTHSNFFDSSNAYWFSSFPDLFYFNKYHSIASLYFACIISINPLKQLEKAEIY